MQIWLPRVSPGRLQVEDKTLGVKEKQLTQNLSCFRISKILFHVFKQNKGHVEGQKEKEIGDTTENESCAMSWKGAQWIVLGRMTLVIESPLK